MQAQRRQGLGGIYSLYNEQRVTEPFIINNRCIECRICENVCPEQVIKVYCRRPVWNEEKCSMCICCLEICPKQAIDYGDAPVGRRRFYNKVYYEGSIGIKLKR